MTTRLQSFLIDHSLYRRLPSFTPFSHEFTVRGTDDAALLRARLSVLRAMRLVDHAQAERTCRVSITGLTMTTDTMQAFSALPDWGGELSIGVDTWPLQPAAYKELGRQVPVTYSTWRFQGSVLPDVLDSISDELNARRAGMDLPRVALFVTGRGADEKRGAHVFVHYVVPCVRANAVPAF